ncbi:DUF6680 family protein [Paenibacillus sp. NPDC058071]|uniref:DUF6680 family protein n=1 Tax=Paenibacillus sp. NPDC058071 TaxID=3346326 RepID=UPI0036DBE525
MSSVPGWLYAVLVFFSGLVGVIVTLVTTSIRQGKRDRYETYLQFMQYRNNASGEEFLGTLNKMYVVFRNDKEVIEALTKLLDGATYEKPGTDEMNRRLIKIYFAMCKSLHIKQLEEHVFLRPFS